MAKCKVVFVTRTIEPEAWEVFLAQAPPELDIGLANPAEGEDQLMEKVENADFLVVYRARLRDEVIEKAKRLKLVQTTSQGVDHIPVRAAVQKGIYVANIGGANALSVAELAVLLMLAVMRRLVPSFEALRKGTFQPDTMLAHQLYGKTVGVVGFGNIGRRVAKLVHGFGTNIIFYEQIDVSEALAADFQARQVSLEELLKNADIVTLHVPLLESTRHMLGWEQLALMKPQAFLINTSRGAVVDETALIRALREKRIAGAGLDVFEEEPPKPENPLLHMDNVVATPHIGALAWENWAPRVKVIWDNVRRVMEGKEPRNIIRNP